MKDSQRIVELRSQNFKRLTAVTIRPDGNVVQVTGRNGHGKSSTLDSIWAAIGGKEAVPREPIRKGQTAAEIVVKLNDLIVTRKFKRSKEGEITTSLQVTNAEGLVYKTPQAVLDSLVGQLTFDPLAFTRMPPRQQFDTLRKFVPDVDFDEIDRLNRMDYELRTSANRQARDTRGAATSIVMPEGTPEQSVDEAALIDELQQAGDTNADIEQRKQNRARSAQNVMTMRQTATGKREEAEALIRRAGELQEEANALDRGAAALQDDLDLLQPLPAPVDTSEVRQRIENAREVNRRVALLKRRRETEAAAKRLEEQADVLTKQMEERTAKKQAAIAAAKMPVAGIEFGDGIVLLNAVPFEQASDAEKLRTSVAIAAALNPKLRVICVRDGSLLDANGRVLLAEIASQYDMQIWLEVVSDGGNCGFVIEDGMLKGDNDGALKDGAAQESAA